MDNIPGFVDLQVNGFLGVDFSAPDLSGGDFARACRAMLAQGTAAFLPTVITSPADVYERNLRMIAAAMALPEFDGRLLGIHLEGPFISAEPGAVGAHDPQWVRPPSVEFFDKLYEWADRRVKLLTLAAGSPGAEELARHAVSRGAAVSLGHHLATQADIERLVGAGATALTHLGNGVPQVLDRHANPIWAGLAADPLSAMIITDGHHLPAAVIKTIIRAKGPGRVIVVSDAASLAGLPPGRYTTLGNEVVLEESGLLHSPEKGCMVGSSATMLQCMNHLASLNIFNLDELLQAGFYNPLRLIGVDPESIRGEASLQSDEDQPIFRVRRARSSKKQL